MGINTTCLDHVRAQVHALEHKSGDQDAAIAQLPDATHAYCVARSKRSIDRRKPRYDPSTMTFVTTALAAGLIFLAVGEPAKAPAKDVASAEELRCEKIKVVEVAEDKEGKIEVRSPAEIPLDTKVVTIGRSAVSVQLVKDRGKPALDLQSFRIVNAGTTAIHAVQESGTNITALALDRTTGRMVLSRATAGDRVAPGAAGHIAYFQCARSGK